MNDRNDEAGIEPELIPPGPDDSGHWDDQRMPARPGARRPRRLPRRIQSSTSTGAPPFSLASELLPFLEILLRRWRRLLAWGVSLGLLGLALGFLVWKKEFTAAAQLVRYDSPSTVDVFGYRQIAQQTFVGMFHSPELLRKVASLAKPPVSPEALAKQLRVMPEHNSDIFAFTVSASSPAAATDLVNLYAQEAVRFTQKMQADSSREVSQYLQQQIAQLDREILATHGQGWSVPEPPQKTSTAAPARKPVPAPRSSHLAARLETAREELFDLLTRFTDAHPLVVAQRAKIDAIEKQLRAQAPLVAPEISNDTEAPADTGPARSAASPQMAATVETDPEVLRSKLQSLENNRVVLVGRQRAAQSFSENPPGYFQMLAPAAVRDVLVHGRKVKVIFLALFLGLVGVVGASFAILSREVLDDRLKTAADVKRVTRLPLLASLGDLNQMSPQEQRDWAFRTWTTLQHNMSRSPNHGLVCGVTSSCSGEGRSTWVNLLAREASELGFRVLTIAASRPAQNGSATTSEPAPQTPPANGAPAGTAASESALLAANVLATPAEVTEKLTGPNPQPVVHIPLPGWVWNLERRKQWQAALNHWRKIDNIVILVELPPASLPEAVLLAENLPNLLWLASSGRPDAARTRINLQTLRDARCHLAGVVLNRQPRLALQNRFPRWIEYAT